MKALLLSICLIDFCFIVVARQEKVTLANNGYSGITVSISDNIAENQQILDKLKEAFTSASSVLYKATKQFVYFKDVTIIVPKLWSSNIKYGQASSSRKENAHFSITVPSSAFGNKPSTYGLTECGGKGLYVHLTPDLVTSSVQKGYGKLDKILVHEWAHLRWGIFDEYPTSSGDGLSQADKFYNDEGTWKPVMCTDKIEGDVLRDCSDYRTQCFLGDTGKPHPFCNFCVKPANRAVASLMAFQWLDSVVQFCDKKDSSVDKALHHDSKAPNDQNNFCSGRSAWEIMRENNDFKAPNQAGLSSQSTTPVFNIVQETDERIVLVLDVSGSMKSEVRGVSRIKRLVDTVSYFILHTVPEGSEIGLVTFSNTATVVETMTNITSDTIRRGLVTSLSSLVAAGRTSIGDGLLKGLNLLKLGKSVVNGNRIIMVTDGAENVRPFINDVLGEIKTAGVAVNTLAFGSTSDKKLAPIADETGGRSFFYTENTNSTALQDVFTESVSGSDASLQIAGKGVAISGASAVSGSFYVDSSVGKNTVLQLMSSSPETISIKLTSPDGNTYSGTDIVSASSQSLYRGIVLPGLSPVGKYSYTITSSKATDGILTVQSSPRTGTSSGLQVKAWMPDVSFSYGSSSKSVIYAFVHRDNNPILNVAVVALLENEQGDIVTIKLKDLGIGFDLKANDGVYSGVILSQYITQNGRLNIRVTIVNTDGDATEVTSSNTGVGSSTIPGTAANPLQKVPMELFQRVLQVGEMSVTNYDGSVLSDNIPPSKITTLALVSINDRTTEVTVTWTAVGDDIDIGTVTMYDIRLGTDIDLIRSNPATALPITGLLGNPKSPGETEILSFRLPNNAYNNTFYMSVRAIDDKFNFGPNSNILSFSILIDKKWIPPRSDASADETILIGLLFAACVSVLFLIAVLTATVYTYERKKHLHVNRLRKHRHEHRQSKHKHERNSSVPYYIYDPMNNSYY